MPRKRIILKRALTLFTLILSLIPLGCEEYLGEYLREPYSSTPTTQYTPTEKMETTLPTINITSPSKDSHFPWGGTAVIRVNAYDASGIQKVTFSAIPGGHSYTAYSEPWEWYWRLPGRSGDGGAQWYSITATAYDNYGNSRSTSIHIRVGKEY
ncbi:MAG: Ig-like domain-containing protein [Candidatus Edwardsbacteria bacterium]